MSSANRVPKELDDFLRVKVGDKDFIFQGADETSEERMLDYLVARDEESEIRDIAEESDVQTAIAVFDGHPAIEIIFTEEEIAAAKRKIATAHHLGMDAIGAFPPLHFEGGSIVTVDREGTHIMSEGDK